MKFTVTTESGIDYGDRHYAKGETVDILNGNTAAALLRGKSIEPEKSGKRPDPAKPQVKS